MNKILPEESRAVIRAYAAEEPDSKPAAMEAYYNALEDGVYKTDPHMLFMHEATSSVPDLFLRARYRKEVLEN